MDRYINYWNMLNLNYICILLIVITWDKTQGCLWNSDCPCEIGPRNNIVINCNNRQLTSLPDLRLKNYNTVVEEINLSDNLITEIPAFSFNHSSFKHLKSIDLSRNPIERLHHDSFTGLELSLTELILEDLTSNDFYFVSLNLEIFSNLETVVVSHFKDQFLPDNYFKNLTKIKKISLTDGSLYTILPNTFSDQHDSLEELDLSKNDLDEVPTVALSKLQKLTSLSLSHNPIKFRHGSFETMSKLKILEIDHTTNIIESGSFSGLEHSLEIINVAVNRWTDTSFSHITILKNLIFIEAGFNQLIKLNIFLDGKMKNLKYLNLEMNRINEIDNSGNHIESQSLQTLNLESNPLSQVHPDSFKYLTSLKSLNLKHSSLLSFYKNTFISQKDTLESLSISSSKISGSKWETLMQLHSLKQLEASDCGLPNIPDLTFQQFSNLENLFLNQNNITNLTQQTFFGLGNSLIKLSLSGNNLTTIDKCAFEGLHKLDLLDLEIDENPLKCDCQMKWLYEKINSFRDDPRNVPLISMLQWKCHDLGIMFKDLESSHFSTCQETTTCETVTISTLLPRTTTPSTNPYLNMYINNVTSSSFVVSWEAKVDIYSKINLKSYETSNRGNFVANISTKKELREHKISDLKPSSEYTVLVTMFFSNGIPPVELKSSVKTQDKQDNMKAIIIGTCLGIVLGILLLLTVIYFIITCRKQPKLPVVEVTDQSRRFVKYTDSVKSSNKNNYREFNKESVRLKHEEPLYTDVIKSTLDQMSNEEKYKLVNLLTKSTEGLNERGRDNSRVYDRGEYDQIPANYYEEIKENR